MINTNTLICVFQLPQQLAVQFCPTCCQPVPYKVQFLRVPRVTWAELHENKRPDWLTRNSSCDHRLKFGLEAISATFHTNIFPATFAAAFGINGFIQIA